MCQPVHTTFWTKCIQLNFDVIKSVGQFYSPGLFVMFRAAKEKQRVKEAQKKAVKVMLYLSFGFRFSYKNYQILQ